MRMLVMGIGKVSMCMLDSRMPVHMPMRDSRCNGEIMGMLMVFVMHMFVFVLQLFMNVAMLMLLGEMEPNAERHQQPGNDQRCGERFTQCQGQ